MYKYKRNGFTLVELMAVITIISLIALLTFPNIINQIKKTKKSNNKMIEDVVIEQAKKYVSDNKDEFQDKKYCVSIDTLVDKDYIKDSLFKNNDFLDKKVIYITNEKDYEYNIVDKDKCSIYDYVDNNGKGYYKVKYLESTGTQYIDTKVKGSKDLKIDVSYYVNDFNASRNYVFGTANSDGNRIQWSHANSSLAGYGSEYKSIATNNDNKINHIVLDKGAFYLNNTNIYDKSNSNYNFSSDMDSIILFGCQANGTMTNYSSIRIYSAKIYKGNNLILDYVPVKNSDNIGCLFDKIEKKCYYNQGEDNFYYPHEISDYTEIEYLESTGTQYIDTKVKGSKDLKIDVSYYVNDFNASRNYVFGTANSDGNRIQWSHANPSLAGYGNEYTSISTNNNNKINHIVLDKGAFYLNNINIYDKSNSNYNFSSDMDSIILFGCQANGTMTNYSSIRIYSAKIYKGSNLILDYTPIIDYNGKPCLYDKVEKKCYYNQGTGEFLYG